MCEVLCAQVVRLVGCLALGKGLVSLLQPQQSTGEHGKPPHDTRHTEKPPDKRIAFGRV